MKIKTGRLEIDGQRKIRIKEFEGDLVKIVFFNSKGNFPTAKLKITTEEGETIVDKEVGNKSMIFYPYNHNAKTGLLNLDSATSVITIGESKDRHYIDGTLIVEFSNFGKGSIEDLIIYFKPGRKYALEGRKRIQDLEIMRSLLLGGYANRDTGRQEIEEIRREILRLKGSGNIKNMGEKRRQKTAARMPDVRIGG